MNMNQYQKKKPVNVLHIVSAIAVSLLSFLGTTVFFATPVYGAAPPNPSAIYTEQLPR